MKLKDKVAIVTGGASGLGKSIVELLLQNDSKVVVLDINKETLNSLDKNENILKIICDITKEEELSSAIAKSIEKFSKVLFLAKGNMSVTLESDCQTCFKKALIKLNFILMTN